MPAFVNLGRRYQESSQVPALGAPAEKYMNGSSNGGSGITPAAAGRYPVVGNVTQTNLENVPGAIGRFYPNGHVDVRYQLLATHTSTIEPSYGYGASAITPQTLPTRQRSPIIKTEDAFDDDSFRTGPSSSTGLARSSHSSFTTQDSPSKFPADTDLKEQVDSNATQDSQQRGKKRKREPPVPRRLKFSDLKPRTSIPGHMSQQELARQGLEAALGARLNPFALHPEELALLNNRISRSHVTTYISIRNRILRLWSLSPLASVTAEEAAGCASSARFLNLAQVAYEWLIRRGYINFGVLETGPFMADGKKVNKNQESTQKIVVIGAGMAGIGCARQLEGLLNCFADRWTSKGLQPPKVELLEARSRIGGRIYSHPLHNQNAVNIPKGARCTAEMGAHIVIGFKNGNPLNSIIRGQLALRYHDLKDVDEVHDINGKVVDKKRDENIQRLFNEILENADAYRHNNSVPTPIEGDRALISNGKDALDDGGGILQDPVEASNVLLEPRPTDLVFAGIDRLTGRVEKLQSFDASELSYHASMDSTPVRELPSVNETAYPSLGSEMDRAVTEMQRTMSLQAVDLRLLNWHFANLEYANATNVSRLSLGGWDQDTGNDFEGEHAQVVGGYVQVPRALLQHPKPLDLKTRKVVRKISYSPHPDSTKATIHCADGELISADHVVLTSPLGVLKAGDIEFEPALPSDKQEAIKKLGFGVLNKVILVYDKPFWDVNQDMIGLLRDADKPGSLDQSDYSRNRGRFYLFWNCVKTSGRPVLIALLAGDAAEEAEVTPDGELVAEVSAQLRTMFHDKYVPDPSEVIVSRWRRDPFAQGTYSYVGVEGRSEHYDFMARALGNLHFAGEATCGTHPATVHGAYISGLRAAGEIIDSLLGPIDVPSPLVPTEIIIKSEPRGVTIKAEPIDVVELGGETPAEKTARLEAFETEILKAIFEKLGPRPDKPNRSGANPFLVYSQEKWAECKAQCDTARQAATGNPNAKAQRNEIRAALGQMWRQAPDSVKQPYLDLTSQNQAKNANSRSNFAQRLEEWDQKAIAIRADHVKTHPGVISEEEEKQMWQALGLAGGQSRLSRRTGGLA